MASGATGIWLIRVVAVLAIATTLQWVPRARAQVATSGQSTIEKAVEAKGPPSAEMWLGAEGFRDVLSLYSGVTWAPSGDLRGNGFRVRASGGMGRYTTTSAQPCVVSGLIEECAIAFPVMRRFAQGLVGWQQQWRETTVKAFVGVAYADERLSSKVTHRYLAGPRVGPAVALEVWHNFTPGLWGSLDLSFARPDMEWSARGRLGVRFGDYFSVGPETGFARKNDAHLVGNDGHIADAKIGQLQRYGAFARWDAPSFELSASAGVALSHGPARSLYLSAQYLTRF